MWTFFRHKAHFILPLDGKTYVQYLFVVTKIITKLIMILVPLSGDPYVFQIRNFEDCS